MKFDETEKDKELDARLKRLEEILKKHEKDRGA
jgi:hypothetical protein